MGKNDYYCVGPCENDKRYPDKRKKRSHAVAKKWHRFLLKREGKNGQQ